MKNMVFGKHDKEIELLIDADETIKSMMSSYPEASDGNSLVCTKFDYDTMIFQFSDEETEATYTIGMYELRQGFKKLLLLALNGGYYNNEFPKAVLSKERRDIDATDCDALVQCAIFGEVKYG